MKIIERLMEIIVNIINRIIFYMSVRIVIDR